MYLRLKTKEHAPREFDGFFSDGRAELEESYWPSAKATLTRGRLFELGTVRFTGVEIKSSTSLAGGALVLKPKVTVDAEHGLPIANALAAGLKKRGLSFHVDVTRAPEAGENSYFGSAEHGRALDQQRRGAAAAQKAKGKRDAD